MHKKMNFVEFYITNVCNIACDGCNRFNNLKLTGHDNWTENLESYENFAKAVDVIGFVNILGGEPLMHPKINTIMTDLRRIFPTQEIRICTNGLLLHKIKGFWESLVKNKIKLDVSIHNASWRKNIYDKLCNLTGEKIKLKWTLEPRNRMATFDHKDVTHIIHLSDRFYQNAFGDPYSKTLKPYDSDPDEAHRVCDFRHKAFGLETHSPTIMNGRLFKCPMANSMPIAIRQRNDIEYTEKQKDLIDTFPYFECSEIHKITTEEFDTLMYNTIPQCSLCPVRYDDQAISDQQISKNLY